MDDLEALAKFISPERLRALLALTGSLEVAVELHQETLRVGSSLMTVIATLEIALRNSVCENLGQHFGISDWLLRPPISFQWRKPEQDKIKTAWDSARRAEYSKLSQTQKHALDALAYPNGRPSNKSHSDRAKDRRRKIQVSDGKVVAELTFFFWKRLFGPEYNQSLWRPSLKKVFPDKRILRSLVATQLEFIYQARNRLAHHEPVLHRRFSDTMKAIDFVASNLDAKLPGTGTPLSKLLAPDLSAAATKSAALHATLDKFRK